jgi:spore coat protein U-like protein
VRWIEFFLVLLYLIWPGGVSAQQCTVSSTPVSFGEYDTSAGGPLNATGSISVSCTETAAAVVKLDPGKHSGGVFTPRKMQGDVDYLEYNLYTDPANTKTWGDGTGNTFTQTGAENLIVYGSIPPHQKVRPGVYGDSVTIIVEW